MNTRAALITLIGMIVLSASVHADNATSVQITGTEVENFCYFDGATYSPGASLCDPYYAGRVLTCQPKGNKLPVPPGSPPNTATLNSTVAGWSGAEDPRCEKK
jgi:hypothetical protein